MAIPKLRAADAALEAGEGTASVGGIGVRGSAALPTLASRAPAQPLRPGKRPAQKTSIAVWAQESERALRLTWPQRLIVPGTHSVVVIGVEAAPGGAPTRKRADVLIGINSDRKLGGLISGRC